MIKIVIQICILMLTMEMSAFAVDAPALTDKDFLEQIFINYGRRMTISVDGGHVEAEYIQEVDIEKWSQGKRIFFDHFLIPLTNGSRKPTVARILNPDDQFIEVTEENSGVDKFFSKLNESYHNKMACKYQLTIPHLAAKTLPNEFQKRTYYPAVQETDFIIYLIADKDDLLNPAIDEEFLEPVVPSLQYNVKTFAPPRVIPQLIPAPAPVITHAPVVVPTPVVLSAPILVSSPPPSSTGSSITVSSPGSELEVRMHKGKKWLFKGSTPIRPL